MIISYGNHSGSGYGASFNFASGYNSVLGFGSAAVLSSSSVSVPGAGDISLNFIIIYLDK
jgi:hypothetical protein